MVASGRGPTRSSADFRAGRAGCCTTVRVLRGEPTRIDRHVERLRRDADRLGLEQPGPREISRLLIETASRHFPRPTEGIVRIEWSGATAARAPRLRASARALEPAPDRWRVRTALTRHPGPQARRNTKQIGVAAYESARAEAAVDAVDEVLLFDGDGRVVEGSFTNLLIVTGDDALYTPALSLGPVEGIGLAIVRESVPALAPARLGWNELVTARELMAVNVVRGIAAIVELDGHRIGRGRPGPWARRLGPLFEESSPRASSEPNDVGPDTPDPGAPDDASR